MEKIKYYNPFAITVKSNGQYYFGRSSQLMDMTAGFSFHDSQVEELVRLTKGEGASLDRLQEVFDKKVIDYWLANEIIIDQKMDMSHFYSRVQGYYEHAHLANSKKLLEKSVMILGCGGIGTHVAWNLMAAGVGKLVLVDYDVVELSNLNRQLLYDTNDIGKSKVAALKQKLGAINPLAQIETLDVKIESQEQLELILKENKCDLVVKSIDSPEDLPKWLDYACKKHNINYISGTLTDTFSVVGPTFVANKNTKGYADIFSVSNEYKHVSGITPSLSSEVSHAAALVATEAIRVLMKVEKLEFVNKVHFSDILASREMDIYAKDEEIEIDEEKKFIYNKNLLLLLVSLLCVAVNYKWNIMIWSMGAVIPVGAVLIFDNGGNVAKACFNNILWYYMLCLVLFFAQNFSYLRQYNVIQVVALILVIFIVFSFLSVVSVGMARLLSRLKSRIGK